MIVECRSLVITGGVCILRGCDADILPSSFGYQSLSEFTSIQLLVVFFSFCQRQSSCLSMLSLRSFRPLRALQPTLSSFYQQHRNFRTLPTDMGDETNETIYEGIFGMHFSHSPQMLQSNQASLLTKPHSSRQQAPRCNLRGRNPQTKRSFPPLSAIQTMHGPRPTNQSQRQPQGTQKAADEETRA